MWTDDTISCAGVVISKELLVCRDIFRVVAGGMRNNAW
jgi:hypothetical protein